MSDRDLTCREVVELVNDYLEGDLPLVERARFERHLDACPGCAVYLEQMRQTIAAIGRLDVGQARGRGVNAVARVTGRPAGRGRARDRCRRPPGSGRCG